MDDPTTDQDMGALTAQIASDLAGLGVALIGAGQVLASVRTSVPVTAPALSGLLPLCTDGGAVLVRLARLLEASVLVERGEWQRIVGPPSNGEACGLIAR